MSAVPINPYLNIEPEYPCPRCKLLFSKTIDLYAHLRETHPSPKRCHICKHEFDAFASLLSHSYLHTDSKPFVCGYPNCEYATRTKQNILVHMHFCDKCPAKKYKAPFPLPDRYKSSYKYQATMEQHKQNISRPKPIAKRKKKRKITNRKKGLINKVEKDKNDDGYEICYSPKRTRNWHNINSNDSILLTPPTKRYIKTGIINVVNNNCNGWKLEMHKCITTKSQIVIDAVKLISSQLNSQFVKSCQPKGLHIACLRDNNNKIQSAAIINNMFDNNNYIEIKSFATSTKHQRQYLGLLLMSFILERCNGKIIIGARDTIGVISFWESIGFVKCTQGMVSTFGRRGVVMMQTIAPYKGIYEYALNKFNPNTLVKKIIFINKFQNRYNDKFKEIRTPLIAKLSKNIKINNHNNNKHKEPSRKRMKL